MGGGMDDVRQLTLDPIIISPHLDVDSNPAFSTACGALHLTFT